MSKIPFKALEKPVIHDLLTPYNFNDANNVGRIKYIVIHYVGALGGAKANCQYYASGYIGASAHIFVGFEGEYWRSVKEEDIAWHCGAGTAYVYRHPDCRNSNSIGIEMCVRKDSSGNWYFEKETVEATIRLTRHYMKLYGIPEKNVIRHYDVTGKLCGAPYVSNKTEYTWTKFKVAINQPQIEPGWQKAEKGWWYLYDNHTYPAEEWNVIGRNWFYFDKDGYLLTGKQMINGKEYCLYDRPGSKEGACMRTDDTGALYIWDVR